MFWDKMQGRERGKRMAARALAVCAGATMVAGLGGAAMAQSMVVRSTGPSAPSYPAGKKLATGSTIVLKANDRVTVLDKKGTRVLSGPGNFTLDGTVTRDQTGSVQVAKLLSSSSRRARTGAVRGGVTGASTGPTDPNRSPNLWYIDSGKSGKVCVAADERLLVWRADKTSEYSAQLSNGAGSSAELLWKRGATIRLWPKEDSPLVDGASYSLEGSDGAIHTIELKLVDAIPEDFDELAEMLIAQGCENQLSLLVDTLASAPAAEPDSEGEG